MKIITDKNVCIGSVMIWANQSYWGQDDVRLSFCVWFDVSYICVFLLIWDCSVLALYWSVKRLYVSFVLNKIVLGLRLCYAWDCVWGSVTVRYVWVLQAGLGWVVTEAATVINILTLNSLTDCTPMWDWDSL